MELSALLLGELGHARALLRVEAREGVLVLLVLVRRRPRRLHDLELGVGLLLLVRLGFFSRGSYWSTGGYFLGATCLNIS